MAISGIKVFGLPTSHISHPIYKAIYMAADTLPKNNIMNKISLNEKK